MPLVIDTYNVLHTVGILPPDLAGIEIDGLIGLITRSRYRAEKTTLVCDGRPAEKPTGHHPSILIRYSGPGKPADDLIGQIIRASTAPRRLLVVSTDHAVQRAARKRRCRVLTSEEFLTHLAEDANLPVELDKPKTPVTSMTQEQVDRWVKVFSLDDETAELKSLAPVQPDQPKKAPRADTAKSTGSGDHADNEIPNLPGGPVLPQELIEEAERLLKMEEDRNGRGQRPVG